MTHVRMSGLLLTAAIAIPLFLSPIEAQGQVSRGDMRGMRGMGGGGFSDTLPIAMGRLSSPVGRFSPLITTIITTIEPDSWEENGGPGSIIAIDSWGLLIVSQTEYIHQGVENLILTIRRARFQQASDYDRSGEHSAALPKNLAVRPSLLVSESPARPAGREKIEKALSSVTAFDFVDVPLNEVLKQIAKKSGISIYLDRTALDDEGIGADTPVTFKVQNISLHSALKLVFQDLGLTCCIKNEVLLITTQIEAQAQQDTRVYMVADLAVPIEK